MVPYPGKDAPRPDILHNGPNNSYSSQTTSGNHEMSKTLKPVTVQALQLKSAERAQLAELLMESLGDPDTSIARLWAKEAESRLVAFQRGEISAKNVKAIWTAK